MLQTLEGHTDEIFSCAFNYDGDIIITGPTQHCFSAVFTVIVVVAHTFEFIAITIPIDTNPSTPTLTPHTHHR